MATKAIKTEIYYNKRTIMRKVTRFVTVPAGTVVFLDNGNDQFTRQYFEAETTERCELINDRPLAVKINGIEYTVPDARLDDMSVWQDRQYYLNYEDEEPGDEVRRGCWSIGKNDFLDLIECYNPSGYKLRTRAEFSTVWSKSYIPSALDILEVIAACKKERS